jgi:hypothetical protein
MRYTFPTLSLPQPDEFEVTHIAVLEHEDEDRVSSVVLKLALFFEDVKIDEPMVKLRLRDVVNGGGVEADWIAAVSVAGTNDYDDVGELLQDSTWGQNFVERVWHGANRLT